MRRCRISRHAVIPRSQHAVTLPRRQRLHTSAPSQTSLSLSLHDLRDLTTSLPGNSMRRVLLDKLETLRDLVTREHPFHPSPERVWGSYLELVRALGSANLPLEIHQLVLRKCTGHHKLHRVLLARRIADGTRRGSPHAHEARFQAIIRNIRSSGFKPALDDYHFILRQFAAVGHHEGMMQVMEEIRSAGLAPTAKTFGLCFQALCHRLALPCWHKTRPALVSSVVQTCQGLLKQMSELKRPFTSVNVDLVLRILKESSELETFETLLKMAYAVDLSFPDRLPLDYWQKGKAPATALPLDVNPLPLSPSALNTIVDMIGRSGRVSTMVQTFEVLTTPLGSGASSLPTSFDEDEEDDFGPTNPLVAPFPVPHAKPNSTTYYMLLKWISRAKHHTFARHYLLQAVTLDATVQARLIKKCRRRSAERSISAPHFSISRSLFLPVFSLANVDKDTELMYFVLAKANNARREKRKAIRLYERMQEKWREQGLAPICLPQSSSDATAGASPEEAPLDFQSSPDTAFTTFFTPSSSLASAERTTDLANAPYLDVDLDQPETPVERRPFDINLHLRILRKEVQELEDFLDHGYSVSARNVQRVKEKLGRRVWRDQDIYMRDAAERVTVNRDEWRQKANFRADRPASLSDPGTGVLGGEGGRGRPPHPQQHSRPGWLAARHGL